MSREIIFRGKRVDDGEWIYGGWFSVDHENYIITNCDNVPVFDLWNFAEEVIPETIGQFTGLTDKNGKKIFEGDILQSIKYSEIKSEVSFDDGAFGFYYDRTHIVVAFSDSEEGVDAEDYEVIGNKWDNPELLGENK